MKQADELRFNEDGLIPAIVQDAASKEVLTLAYMNRESYEKQWKQKKHGFTAARGRSYGTREKHRGIRKPSKASDMTATKMHWSCL